MNRSNYIQTVHSNDIKKYFGLLFGVAGLIVFLVSCIETYVANPDEETDEDDSSTVINSDDFSLSSVEALADNFLTHENASDYTWSNASVIKIIMNGQSVAAEGSGLSISGSTVNINSAGNYLISGSLSDGQIVVNTDDTSAVRIILDNTELACSAGPVLKVEKALKTIIVATEGTSNKITETATADSSTAAVYSNGNLTLCGSGKLAVKSTHNDAIVSMGGLIVASAAIDVVSGNDGMVGKDYLVVKSGSITVDAGGDGLKSNNGDDATKGYLALVSGKIGVTSLGDALSATTDVIVVDGTIEAVTTANSTSSGSAKGIKGLVNVIIENGTIGLNCADNAIHSKGNVAVNGGNLTIETSSDGADGINSGSLLTIAGGTLAITVEGKQSKALKSDQTMTLKGGDMTIATKGDVLLEASGSGYETSYCTGLKCDGDITIDGSNITIVSSGIAGKGVSADGKVTVLSGSLSISTTGNGSTYTNTSGTTDAYNSTCISSDGALTILGGTLDLSASGSAGKGISSLGEIVIGSESTSPKVTITTTGSKITVSGSSSSGGGGGFGGGGPGGGSTADYSAAKAMKSDAAITIHNGTIVISSSDDGIKSEKSVVINNGSVTILKSTEGIESPVITVNNGTVNVSASDDALNATAGLTAGGTEANDGSLLTINGGTVAVNASGGDAIDSNGSFTMNGGTVIAQGPSSSPELGMDVNGTIGIAGGCLVVSGPNSGNMIEAPSTSSAQYSVKVTSSSIGTNLLHIKSESGEELLTFKPVRSAYYVVFSSPGLKTGSNYSVYIGGSSTGTSINGYYSGGTYSDGSFKKSFTVTGKVTSVSF